MGDIRNAIMDLQEYIGSGEYNGSDSPIYLNTANMAISALEKQIPKKFQWVLHQGKGNNYQKCSFCDEKINPNNKEKHCSNCGQAIDWSVEE